MRKDIPVEQIDPNKFNPNVMTKEEFDTLCLDMKNTGPEDAVSVKPILVSPKKLFYNDPKAERNRYVIIDGEHRWRAAKINKWPVIPCEVEELSEDLGHIINYRRNKERGHIDPVKEAKLFKMQVDKGLKHGEIASAFVVDRTTVVKRLSLLNITTETWKALEGVPRGTLAVSHFEPLATLKPELQKEATARILRNVEYGHTITVSAVDRVCSSVKEADKARRELEAAVKDSKFPLCFKCKQPPVRAHWEGLPWVVCENNHSWNLKTGKEYRYSWQEDKEEKSDEPKVKVPKTLRSNITVKEFNEGLQKIMKAIVPQFSEIKSLDVRGTFKGAVESTFDVNLYRKSTHIRSKIAGKDLSVTLEEKDYKTGEKTKVCNVWPEPQTEEDIEKIQKFLKSIKEGAL